MEFCAAACQEHPRQECIQRRGGGTERAVSLLSQTQACPAQLECERSWEEKEEVEKEEAAAVAGLGATPSLVRYSRGVEEEKARNIRLLRSSKKLMEYEEVGAPGTQFQRLTRSSTKSTGEEEKEPWSTQFRRAPGSVRRNAGGDEDNVRSSVSQRAKSYALGQKDREEKEVEVRRSLRPKRSTGGDLKWRKEEEEMQSTRSLRFRRNTTGGAKAVSAEGITGKNVQEALALAPSTGSRPAKSSTSGDVKAREKEKHGLSTPFLKQVSARVQKVVGGEDEAVLHYETLEAISRAGAGDEVSSGTPHYSEEESVLQPPEPNRDQDCGNNALAALAQCAVPSKSGEVTPPTASHWREIGKERTQEDEDLDLIGPLLRIKDQIKQQLLEYKAKIEASKERLPEESTEEGLLQMTEELEKKLEGVKINVEMKTLALKRVQMANALQKKLESKDSESQFLLAILKKILTLNSSILKAQQETHDLEEKLLEVKKKRLRLKQAGEEKLLEIQAEDKKKKEKLELLEDSALLSKLKKNLQREIESTTVIQNVFQHIIIATKIDWASDPDLKVLVLQLENNLSLV
uniref:Centromere protein H n=1 Tax=Monodelphis domestica TaxID=13616 RepID=F6QC79_MONDO